MRKLPGIASRLERGDAESIPFLTSLPILVALVTMIAVGSVALPIRPLIWSAARECARWAAESIDEATGTAQGLRAAQEVLTGSNMQRGTWTVTVTHAGPFWTRDVPVTCRVDYNVDLSGFGVAGFFAPAVTVPMSTEVTFRIQPFKSRWTGADAELVVRT